MRLPHLLEILVDKKINSSSLASWCLSTSELIKAKFGAEPSVSSQLAC